MSSEKSFDNPIYETDRHGMEILLQHGVGSWNTTILSCPLRLKCFIKLSTNNDTTTR